MLEVADPNSSKAKDQFQLSKTKTLKDILKLLPLNLIAPLQASMIVTLPTGTVNQSTYQPFPDELPRIRKIQDKIEIMKSAIKPRKVVVVGDNGKEYPFLCKPKDDLRKDARIMDFNNVLNKIFQQNPESRKRHLHIRTYSVVPLNETCGLIEWVQNTAGFRPILEKMMAQHYPVGSLMEVRFYIHPGPFSDNIE